MHQRSLLTGEIISDATDGVVPAPAAVIAYVTTLGGFIYAAPSSALESVNNALVAAVLGTFLPLLLIAGAHVVGRRINLKPTDRL